ncbi:50S ribosomal protein L35 [Patescibacteria group bacterium]|nr:50S ribosomal protein L35 [Patescibacteria group bacterium]MBU1907409.1 50S ribosomal protein L35 [Patescibacteria group bacterium]
MKQKTHKALAKRVTITKNKKVLKRHSGQDHFNSSSSSKTTRNKRRDNEMSKTHDRAIKTLLPYS